MADTKEVNIQFFLLFSAKMLTKRPSTEWGLSPVEQRWILVRFVVVLSNCLQQFQVYNVYKDDAHGLDLIQELENGGILMHKFLQRHAFILRALYYYCNEMKYWVISNPLPAVGGGVYSMYKEDPNPNYAKLKYAKGFIGIRVCNAYNYKQIIDILERNWMEFQYRFQDYPPNWG